MVQFSAAWLMFLIAAMVPLAYCQDVTQASIKTQIRDHISAINTGLTALNANDKKMLKDIENTLEMERTKAQLKKYVETDATSPLVVMRKLLVEGYNATIKGHLDKMVPGVANSYFYILSKPARLELIEMLEAVKAKVDAFSAHFKKVDTKFVCKLAKMCYIEDIKAAQIEFSVLWSAVENLKTQCKAFDQNCINKFQHYKTKFANFDKKEIVDLKALLTKICDAKCYTSEGERFNFEKSLLTLDVSVNGMITAIKFAVKHSIVKRLNTMEKKLHFRKEKLNVYKLNVEDATAKDKLSSALENMKKLRTEISTLRQEFVDIFTLIMKLEGWLSKEDFDHLMKAASAMAYRFDGMMKQVTDCINEIETIHRAISFEIDVNDKEAEFLTEYKTMLDNIRRTKQGRHGLCVRIDNYTSPTGEPKLGLQNLFQASVNKFEACGLEFVHLTKTLSASFKSLDNYDALKAKLAALMKKNVEHLKIANKYKFFLHVYKNTYCM